METENQDQTKTEDAESESEPSNPPVIDDTEHESKKSKAKAESEKDQPETADESSEGETKNVQLKEKAADLKIQSDDVILLNGKDGSTVQEKSEINSASSKEKEPDEDTQEQSAAVENSKNEKEQHTTDEGTIKHGVVFGEENAETETLKDEGATPESLTSENTQHEKLTPELTLVLFGDPDAVEPGPNLLLDPDKENEQFSSSLYDLCGRVISVINLLGLQNTDHVPSDKGINAFVLLLPHGLHVSQYRSGVQWLESSFGKGALDYLMTVVTHESNEKCDRAVTDLKDFSGFAAERFYTCTKSLRDEAEILALLEKIDAMVSENEPQSYTRPQSDGQEREEAVSVNSHQLREPGIEVIKEHDGTETSDSQRNTEQCKMDTATLNTMKDTEKLVDCKNEKETTMAQHHRKALLSKLHLQHSHEHKLTETEFLQIGPALKPDICESNVSLTFLKQLMMLDYRARYVQLQQESSNKDNLNQAYDHQSDDNDIDAFCSSSVEYDQSQEDNIHPLDIQMAVFHCSDSFLKQKMVTKLSQCQYALPLLVPDPFTEDIECPLWTFRQIKKTWKKTETTDNSEVFTMKSMPICKAETPMVFCFRLGSPSVSKSQLINTLINDRHSTFFHRNCLGSTKTRLLFDGVAEIAWYCPAGKPNDTFTDCVAFCNLHGDGLRYEKQLNILMDKSSVNVVLVKTLKKGQESFEVISGLVKSPQPLIVLLEDSSCNAVQIKAGKHKVGLKDRSQSDVSEELKRIIRNILLGPCTTFQLETMSETGIRVDENDTHCKKGLSVAKEVMNMIQTVNVSRIKSQFLPCQGQLWHDWCKINKEQYRLKGHVEKDKCEKQKRLKKLRESQCNASCSELMESFIRHLSALTSTEREYFLKWTQILLDSLSIDDLSLILQSYDQKWCEVLDLKKKLDKTNELKSKKAELEQISTELQSATCGLEHIFREMGQIYEAHKSLEKPPKKDQTDWSKYPELAAELMISGHPMELMDGDAGHVPLIWISSLIDEVINKLGDKKVFVLSVLGIQSSGKSTMLNAMFGLQFAVSAGRCTRGAFMQLVKLSEDMRKDFQWDYILVVDTEGLRALELAGNTTIHHDNELATFVIGVGNMTLVNIFGENPSEMQDILQIVVQAFMRMKKVRLSPSCVFVHQNVTDVAAKEKNMDGKRRLQEKLDQMAQIAAKEEGSDAFSFSDVIEFDVQKDVKYFAQLWEGSPPMAPPNPVYSENVQGLKSFILSKASKSSGVTLSKFRTKVQDLWNALLNENFVFSFKNTLEIAVYRKLESQFEKWTWALRSEILNIENQLHTRIENGKLSKVEQGHIHNNMSKTYGQVTTEMTSYFEEEKEKEILIQWKAQFELRIKNFHDDLIRQVTRKLDELVQQKEACRKVDQQKTMFKSKLLQKSKDLAHQLKDKAKDEDELRKQFECDWTHWVQDLTGNTKPIEDIDLDHDLPIILEELGFEWALVTEAKKSENYKKIDKVGDYSSYILQNTKNQEKSKEYQEETSQLVTTTGNMMGKWHAFTKFLGFGAKQQKTQHKLSSYDEEKCIRQNIQQIQKQAMKVLQTKPLAKRGYNQTYMQEVAKSVKENVEYFQSQFSISLKKDFTVDLLLYVFDGAKEHIVASHRNFKVNHDAATFLQGMKKEYYMIFRSFCKGSSSAVVLAKLICEKLRVSMTETVCNRTAIDIAGDMRENFPAFNESRLNLEKHVLKSLAEKEDFDSYTTYIRNPKKHVEHFIKEEVKKYISKKHKNKALILLQKNVDNTYKQLSHALFETTEKVKNNANLNVWLEEFLSLIKNILTFDTVCCQDFNNINNFEFLKEEIEKGLAPIVKEMKNLPLEMLKDFRLQPDQILIDQLCDCCWETCPFCTAVCTNTVKDHSPDKHSVPFHRPSGIEGWHIRGTVELVVDFCTTLVASDRRFYPQFDSDETVPYKQYQTAGGKYTAWNITADASKLVYWKWFLCRFQKELEDYHKLEFKGRGEIPSEWRNYTKEEAIESLDEMYNM